MRLVGLSLALLLIAAAPAAQPVIPSVDWTEVVDDSWHGAMPPPPASGSIEEHAELEQMLDVQARRTPQDIAEARVDQGIVPERFSAVVGRPLDASLPRTMELLAGLSRATRAVADAAKTYWRRPRPYDVLATIKPVIDRPGGPGHPSWSYPSGHAIWGYSTALVLAAMLPERREAILARGRRFGWNRVVSGVHFPSDVTGGELAAVALVGRLARDAGFRRDLDVATRELRAALRLPPRQAELP